MQFYLSFFVLLSLCFPPKCRPQPLTAFLLKFLFIQAARNNFVSVGNGSIYDSCYQGVHVFSVLSLHLSIMQSWQNICCKASCLAKVSLSPVVCPYLAALSIALSLSKATNTSTPRVLSCLLNLNTYSIVLP